MKRLTLVIVLFVILFVSGCDAESVNCESGYILIEEGCIKQYTLDEGKANASIWLLIQEAKDPNISNDSCEGFGIRDSLCTSFNLGIYDFYNTNETDLGRMHFEFDEESNEFRLIRIFQTLNKTLEITGKISVNSRNRVYINDFSYSINNNSVISSSEIRLIAEQALDKENNTDFCSKYNYNLKFHCEDILGSVLLEHLDEVYLDSINENGEAKIYLTSSSDNLIGAILEMNIYKYKQEIYIDSLKYTDTTIDYLSVSQVSEYFEDMFNEGFTTKTLQTLCDIPLRDLESDGYSINKQSCFLRTTNLSSDKVFVHVDPLNAPEAFDVYVREADGLEVLGLWVRVERNDEYQMEFKLEVIDIVTSVENTELLALDFIEAYNIDKVDSCNTYIDNYSDCSSFEIMETAGDLMIVNISRAYGGLFGITYDVTVKNEVTEEEFTFIIVSEIINQEQIITGFHIGTIWN